MHIVSLCFHHGFLKNCVKSAVKYQSSVFFVVFSEICASQKLKLDTNKVTQEDMLNVYTAYNIFNVLLAALFGGFFHTETSKFFCRHTYFVILYCTVLYYIQ